MRSFPIVIMQWLKNPSVYPPPLRIPSLHTCFFFMLHFSSELDFSLVCAGWTSHIFLFLLRPLLSSHQLNFSNWISFPFIFFVCSSQKLRIRGTNFSKGFLLTDTNFIIIIIIIDSILQRLGKGSALS